MSGTTIWVDTVCRDACSINLVNFRNSFFTSSSFIFQSKLESKAPREYPAASLISSTEALSNPLRINNRSAASIRRIRVTSLLSSRVSRLRVFMEIHS